MSKVLEKFSGGHLDVVHHVAYDHYGHRMATCSSDHRIKIWDRDDVTMTSHATVNPGNNNNNNNNSNASWKNTATIKQHSGAVWKVIWGDPEFGSLLASCSFDRTVIIWEEQDPGKWKSVASLVESRDSVRDIAFAPSSALISAGSSGNNNSGGGNNAGNPANNSNNVGLRLAVCSADGFVRIYQALDVMNLAQWSLMEEFESARGGSNCICWNPSRFDPPMIAVGSNDANVKIWEYNDQYRRWQVALILQETFTLGSDLGNNNNANSNNNNNNNNNNNSSNSNNNLNVNENAVIHSVAWAPNMGRSYHLLATASKDGRVRIWKIYLPSSDKVKMEAELVACFDDHQAEVWKVEWNITGTILASSGDDGTIRLWKLSFNDKWQCLSVITGENQQQ